MSALFEARARKKRVLHLRECAEYVFAHQSLYNTIQYKAFFETNIMSDLSCTFAKMALVHALAKVSVKLIAIYFHSFEIFHIQIGEMTFCKPDFIIKSNYFQNAEKGESFFNDFFVRHCQNLRIFSYVNGF
jgi:hypothetical protein